MQLYNTLSAKERAALLEEAGEDRPSGEPEAAPDAAN